MMIGGILLTLFARAIAEASGGAYFDIGLMMYGVVIAGLGVVVLIVSRWFNK